MNGLLVDLELFICLSVVWPFVRVVSEKAGGAAKTRDRFGNETDGSLVSWEADA